MVLMIRTAKTKRRKKASGINKDNFFGGVAQNSGTLTLLIASRVL